MDNRERFESTENALLTALEGWQSGIWTAIPAAVESFDAETGTCSLQPTIQAHVRSKDENPPVDGAVLDVTPWWWVTLPLLVDVPVAFPGGGGWTLTFPVVKGDEALVVFSSRCIDAWWQSSGVQVQAELRMHDLSDGFAFIGPRSKPRALAGLSVDGVQLRNDAGTVKIDLNGTVINVTTTGDVNVTAGGTAKIKAPSVLLQDAGAALKKLVHETFLTFFNSHVHTSASPGSPTSSPTIAATVAANATSVTKAE
jgi:hypothetical protein